MPPRRTAAERLAVLPSRFWGGTGVPWPLQLCLPAPPGSPRAVGALPLPDARKTLPEKLKEKQVFQLVSYPLL